MTKDNEKLFEALDNIAYVARKSGGMILPEHPLDEKPFMISEIKKNLDILIKKLKDDPSNAERCRYYGL